ncbi:hypothetical protein D2T29_02555 [Sinirhodobacter populi]|uniref:HTH DNA binding domain-containing protein n=1 Tax=Paenirhodobacter populi TaxID=2306993 RepID=A0A443KNH4_9RHOB|nr:hypothetical protein [Sinirhodobacter populi]RWR34446.1 hypothetical protein D2T29_02555 [Sinirhodobacter populi]
MTSHRNLPQDDPDEAFGLPSPYDPDPEAGDTAWFLPDLPDDDPADQPGPRADRRILVDAGEWRLAEAAQAAELARAAAELGRLDMMTEHLGEGAVTRLALIEAEAMAWAEGTRLRREEIGRDLMARATDPRLHTDLARARWALRRLEQRPAPPGGLRDFLGLHEADPDTVSAVPDDFRRRLAGAEFSAAAADFGLGLAELDDAHPLTRAAFAYRLWPLCSLSASGVVTEPATAASRIAASENRMIGFAPCATARQVWNSGGNAEERLRRWIVSVRSGALAAMLDLRRLDSWAVSARATTAGIKGRTPARLIDALISRPLLSTEDAALTTGISRDSAERMLARMLDAGVVREITGQSRFRLWTAAT